MTTDLFASLSEQARFKGERNDCAVKAIAAATAADYSTVHGLTLMLGRRKGCGTYLPIVQKAVRELDFEHTEVTLTRNWTVNQIELSNAWKDGQSYLVLTSGHMLAVVDGVVHDWSRGSKRRVKKAWRVSRVAQPAPQPKPEPAKKWERTLEMARKGTTVQQVANTLEMSEAAARSQLQDLRRRGYSLTHKAGWYTVA